MEAVFVKKTHDNMQLSANVIINVPLDKFAPRAFNHLIYNQEISGPWVISYLLRLSDHYTLLDNVKFINLTIF